MGRRHAGGPPTMTVHVTGRSPDSFEIKGAAFSLLVLRLKSLDLDLLDQEMQTFYGEVAGFFDDDLVLIDLQGVAEQEQPLDFTRLVALLKERHLRAVAVRDGNAQQMAAAGQCGLLAARELDPRWQTVVVSSAPVEPREPLPAMVVTAPVRSGQRVYARGSNLVLRAMVNPGGEVIADGDIHVYAPLRGRVIAGARGWAGAHIFALQMDPEIVSIAGVYRTGEEPLPDSIRDRTAMVSLHSEGSLDQLVFEPLSDS